MIKTSGLNHIALKVKDPERTAQFFTDLFNMEITRSTPERAFLKTIGSTDMMTLNRSETEVTAEQGMVHFGFIVEPTQFDAALDTIQAKGTPIVLVNQMVLRGASCITPPGHARITYHNFFYPHQRWQAAGQGPGKVRTDYAGTVGGRLPARRVE